MLQAAATVLYYAQRDMLSAFGGGNDSCCKSAFSATWLPVRLQKTARRAMRGPSAHQRTPSLCLDEKFVLLWPFTWLASCMADVHSA